jgi:hypothetical protein
MSEKFGGNLNRSNETESAELSPEQKKNRDIRRYVIDNISSFELLKNEFEENIINDANRKTSAVISKYGLSPVNIDSSSIYVVDLDVVAGTDHAFYSVEDQKFVLSRSEDTEWFGLMTIHEMFHYKGSNFLPAPVTEAIVERLTNEAVNLDDSSLIGSQVFSGIYTYPEERKALNLFMSKIREVAGSETTTDSHTFSFFAKAHITGDASYLNFLDDLFGPGTLSKFINLGDNTSDFIEFVNKL